MRAARCVSRPWLRVSFSEPRFIHLEMGMLFPSSETVSSALAAPAAARQATRLTPLCGRFLALGALGIRGWGEESWGLPLGRRIPPLQEDPGRPRYL